MRRFLMLVAAVAVAAGTLAAPPGWAASPTTGDVDGPACADIADGELAYDADGLRVRLRLSAPSCRRIAYTVVAKGKDAAGDYTVRVATMRQRGDGVDDRLPFVFPKWSDPLPESVCVLATTKARRDGHRFDRAPDRSCMVLVLGGGSPGTHFR